jgi:hypothetical protein
VGEVALEVEGIASAATRAIVEAASARSAVGADHSPQTTFGCDPLTWAVITSALASVTSGVLVNFIVRKVQDFNP